MFSKGCEYGLKAVIHLCIESRGGKKLKIKEIASAIDSPEPYTAKVLQTLTKRKVISSVKGPGGGFFIDPKAKPIPVIKVIDAIDGRGAFERCGLGLKECSAKNPCPIHDEFISYSSQLKNLLMHKTVQELVIGIESGKTFIINK